MRDFYDALRDFYKYILEQLHDFGTKISGKLGKATQSIAEKLGYTANEWKDLGLSDLIAKSNKVISSDKFLKGLEKANEIKAQEKERKQAEWSNDLQEANDKFNEELSNIDNLPENHVFQLGTVGDILKAVGIKDLPIELSRKLLNKKSSSDYKGNHPFDINSIKDLAKAIQDPIAIFHNPNNDGHVILTELKQDGVNHIAVIKIRTDRKANNIEIENNNVVTVFPKDKIEDVAKWIKDEKGLGSKAYFNKEKSLVWLSDNETQLRLKGFDTKDLANVINNFENPITDSEVENVRFQVSAYHGSPHDIQDGFKTDKIGTGEGVQAFGWGLYFTSLKSIAEGYAKKLKDTYTSFVKEWKKEINDDVLQDTYQFLLDASKDKLTYNELVAEINKVINNKNNHPNKIKRFEELLEFTESNKDKYQTNLYSVTLHKGKTPEQYTWLEWDKPVSDDIKTKIYRAARDGYIPLGLNGTQDFWSGKSKIFDNGNELYFNLSSAFGSDKAASLFLLENGIDGIKYPAESIARGTKSDNARGFNYVVFDENAVTIEEHTQFQKSQQQHKEISKKNFETLIEKLKKPFAKAFKNLNVTHSWNEFVGKHEALKGFGSLENIVFAKQLEAVNSKFNSDLNKLINGTLPKGHIFQLGKAGEVLKSAGVEDLPIELSSDRAKEKSEQKNHPFKLEDLTGLSKSIQNPIAVFDSTKKDGTKVILTELKDNKGNNYVVALRVSNKGTGRLNVEINDVKSVYPKDNISGVLDWINSNDNLLRYANKEKALNYISVQSTNLIGNGNIEKSLNNVTKVIKDFQNPISDKDVQGVQYSILGFHGSPHLFDEFSNGWLYSGEGASGYGEGFYFTESKDDANDYARKLDKGDGKARVYKSKIPDLKHYFDISRDKYNNEQSKEG